MVRLTLCPKKMVIGYQTFVHTKIFLGSQFNSIQTKSKIPNPNQKITKILIIFFGFLWIFEFLFLKKISGFDFFLSVWPILNSNFKFFMVKNRFSLCFQRTQKTLFFYLLIKRAYSCEISRLI
jgi:hypothetical protein